ncbi:hypothetical protein OE88DRAFT_1661226 [Heliocybe sulcata]|uniref:Uncharacterized protein n=1 Tax=Heliocybe sulcata TaxID=5364 RepID=A0A5C3MZP3_9AGAM|nr:hypothetical protein OE88DRAFT_1661226 [Heliocybe sulcata]
MKEEFDPALVLTAQKKKYQDAPEAPEAFHEQHITYIPINPERPRRAETQAPDYQSKTDKSRADAHEETRT